MLTTTMSDHSTMTTNCRTATSKHPARAHRTHRTSTHRTHRRHAAQPRSAHTQRKQAQHEHAHERTPQAVSAATPRAPAGTQRAPARRRRGESRAAGRWWPGSGDLLTNFCFHWFFYNFILPVLTTVAGLFYVVYRAAKQKSLGG